MKSRRRSCSTPGWVRRRLPPGWGIWERRHATRPSHWDWRCRRSGIAKRTIFYRGRARNLIHHIVIEFGIFVEILVGGRAASSIVSSGHSALLVLSISVHGLIEVSSVATKSIFVVVVVVVTKSVGVAVRGQSRATQVFLGRFERYLSQGFCLMRSNVIASVYSRGMGFERAALGLRLSRRGFGILEVDGVLNNGDGLATRKSGKKRDKKISPRSKRISTTRATWLTGTGPKKKKRVREPGP